MESEWSHESTGFLCVAVDAVVEPLQYTSPSPQLSRTGSEARDECSTNGAEGESGIKCTHAALYCMRTIKHSFTQKVLSPPSGRENVPCDTLSMAAMSKERVSSALLGDYSAKVEQKLAVGNRACKVGKATQSEEDATGRVLMLI
jgi:hypothetical protein